MKEHVTCRIDSEILEDAIKIAEKENRSLSNFIETALKSFVSMKKAFYPKHANKKTNGK